MIIYVHGFKSSGNARKAGETKLYFENQTSVLSPTLPVNPVDAILFLENQIVNSGCKSPLLIGSSLGGFYAMVLSVKFNLPAVLLNPALEAHLSLRTQIGIHQNYDTGESFHWTQEHVSALEHLFNQHFNAVIPENIFLLLAEDDELLDSCHTASLIPGASKTLIVPNAGHQFSPYSKYLPEIDSFYKKFQKQTRL